MAVAITIGGVDVKLGERTSVDLRLPNLYTHSEMKMTVKVLCGRKRGPALFLTGALHGDEINGVEIIRRALMRIDHSKLQGLIVAAPIVNVYGFINQSRYLPDRRDLNRSFPGSTSGSLAARLAHMVMNDIVKPCEYGIDFHTAAQNRVNLPQIRADLNDAKTRAGAMAFGAQAAIHSATRDGSLREAASKVDTRVWVFEGGETLRFDEETIEIGTRGVLRMLSHLGMYKRAPRRIAGPTRRFHSTAWIRARQSGVLHMQVSLGDTVDKGQIVANITDPFGDHPAKLRATSAGVVIGHAVTPLVHRGDAVVHVAAAEEKNHSESGKVS